MQSSLLQDGGDTSAGKTNRIVQIDIATGNTKEYAVSNQINGKGYNNSELPASLTRRSPPSWRACPSGPIWLRAA